ncbi:MAG TPA: cytochrome c3 family protein [Anaerolineaceae bacterium]|nr:cytochrome c3 family protein [Anaerolineaceae bacterium]
MKGYLTTKFAMVIILGLAVVLLSACAQASPAPEVPQTVPTQACPEPEPCPELPETVTAPFEELWKNSPHADKESEAFRHWDEDDPMEVPVACATCHSSTGFLDFVGADGSEMFVVNANASVDTVIECQTCHNDATMALTSVQFPSGVELTGLGSEAVCMTCHQGRSSMVQVEEAIANAGVDDDEISESLGFINIHYYAAAVSRYGTQVMGGYEYAGMTYDTLFEHVPGVETCFECHNPHSLELELESCAGCHEANSVEDIRAIREPSSFVDYDGDGDVAEGMYYELEGLKELTFTAIQAYAADVLEMPIGYDSHAYPYFFNDTNGDGELTPDEAIFPNAFKSWTPRLLRAAYNFQTVSKDPGGYAHGGKYLVQLLHDAIVDLNTTLSTPVDISMAARDDAGHFASNTTAWRYWDASGSVPASCAKCHTATGLPQFIKEGTNISNAPTSGLWCESCHNTAEWPAVYEMETVTFPSGAQLGFTDKPSANVCLNCHQGRESTVSVNRVIGDAGDDAVTEGLSFRNIHYFAAGATLFGTDAKGVYEYEGKTYAGQFMHVVGFSTCVDCHDVHGLDVKAQTCQGCHQTDNPENIRMTLTADFDGDGETEGLAGEVETLVEILYAAILDRSAAGGNPLVYDSHSHPYFFNDTNGNGEADPDEVNRANAYASWTPRLLRSAYNYQYAKKDPGAYAHNPTYILQVLYDSIEDVGGNVTDLTRP